ncbi:hypothetical protein GGX14DRAFT_405026 [Mycena pura]|uniref:Uncharacterized protein n=1 Tax=Mycena pura TaxID=153505 RepID=A0AAD6UTC1_9AGAR|nr:hypothetical protein GGX14DRAFT_405026 [Mycena pura]
MSDHPTLNIQTSIIVAGLALVPGNTARYICLGLMLALLGYHAARGQTPAAKMNALTAAIASANELLMCAPSTSVSDRAASMRQALLLRIAEKLRSQLQCRLLEIESHGWKIYFRDVRGLLKGIDKCMKDIERIQTNIQLSIEQDTQRKLDDEIQKCRAMLAAIHAGPRRVTYVSVLSSSFSLNLIRPRVPGDRDSRASCKHFRCVIQTFGRTPDKLIRIMTFDSSAKNDGRKCALNVWSEGLTPRRDTALSGQINFLPSWDGFTHFPDFFAPSMGVAKWTVLLAFRGVRETIWCSEAIVTLVTTGVSLYQMPPDVLVILTSRLVPIRSYNHVAARFTDCEAAGTSGPGFGRPRQISFSLVISPKKEKRNSQSSKGQSKQLSFFLKLVFSKSQLTFGGACQNLDQMFQSLNEADLPTCLF